MSGGVKSCGVNEKSSNICWFNNEILQTDLLTLMKYLFEATEE